MHQGRALRRLAVAPASLRQQAAAVRMGLVAAGAVALPPGVVVPPLAPLASPGTQEHSQLGLGLSAWAQTTAQGGSRCGQVATSATTQPGSQVSHSVSKQARCMQKPNPHMTASIDGLVSLAAQCDTLLGSVNRAG